MPTQPRQLLRRAAPLALGACSHSGTRVAVRARGGACVDDPDCAVTDLCLSSQCALPPTNVPLVCS